MKRKKKNTFIKQGQIKFIKIDRKDIYNVINYCTSVINIEDYDFKISVVSYFILKNTFQMCNFVLTKQLFTTLHKLQTEKERDQTFSFYLFLV